MSVSKARDTLGFAIDCLECGYNSSAVMWIDAAIYWLKADDKLQSPTGLDATNLSQGSKDS